MKSFVVVSLMLTFSVAASLAANCKIGNQELSPNQIIPHPRVECSLLKCIDDGSTEYIGCPQILLATNCRDEGSKNPSASHPDCCERIIKCD